MTVTVELAALEVRVVIGVEDEERRRPQRLLVDIEYDVPEPRDDVLEQTVDYRAVIDCAHHSFAKAFHLVEALASDLAASLLSSFAEIERVRVRVRKVDVELPVAHTGATVELTR